MRGLCGLGDETAELQTTSNLQEGNGESGGPLGLPNSFFGDGSPEP